MPRLILSASSILLLMSATLNTVEACELEISRFQNRDTILANVYNVFSGTPVVKQLAIDIQRLDSVNMTSGSPIDAENPTLDGQPQPVIPIQSTMPDCIPSIKITHEGKLGNVGRELTYTLSTENHRFYSANRSLSFTGDAFEPGDTRRYIIDAVFGAYQFVPSGMYYGDIVADVRSVTRATPSTSQSTSGQSLISSERLTMSIKVPTAARIFLAGTQGRKQTVDFGALTEDSAATRTVGLIVQSTTGYRLHTRSENGGRLLRNDREREHAIDYETTISNRVVNLSNNSATSSTRRSTSGLGDAVNLQFRILDVRNKRAGNYSDTIIVSVIPDISGN